MVSLERFKNSRIKMLRLGTAIAACNDVHGLQMAAHHYPQMEEQCALHRAFREKIIRFSIEWAYRDQTLPNDLLNYLRPLVGSSHSCS